jgi:hypothetical protein
MKDTTKQLVENCLTLSTAHLSPATARLLERLPEGWLENEGMSLRYSKHHHGFIFFVAIDHLPSESAFKDYPELYPIMSEANALGCSLVNFDQDAAESPNFITFEWGV